MRIEVTTSWGLATLKRLSEIQTSGISKEVVLLECYAPFPNTSTKISKTPMTAPTEAALNLFSGKKGKRLDNDFAR